MEDVAHTGSDKTVQKKLTINTREDLVMIRNITRLMAKEVGFSDEDTTLINTAISEVCENVLEYAGEGQFQVEASATQMSFIVEDNGPGISDTERVLQDGYSTENKLGLGLPAAKRIMDSFTINSALNKGTLIKMQKQLKH